MSLLHLLPAQCCWNELDYIPELWCRDWVEVYRYQVISKTQGAIVLNDNSPDWFFYADWWTNTTPSLWTAWSCFENKKDPEVYCFTNDGWATVVSWFIDFDTTTTPSTPKFYDFNLVELIWYSQTSCSLDREKEKECRQVLVPWAWYNIWDEIVLYVYTQGWDNTAPIASYELYYNITTWSYFVPANRTDLWPCVAWQPLSIWSELLNVSWVSTLTPTAWAVYAVISVNEWEAWITVDWTTPVVWDSHPAYEWQYVYLQIADELVDFQAIGNPTAKLYVTYFDKPLLLSQI